MRTRVLFATWALFTVGVVAGEFPAIYNSESTSPLSPQEALGKFRLPEGFKVSLFAAEPDVQQPIAMTFDARGRLWVAENYTYAEGRLNYDLNLRDRIVILEDTNQDGQFDRRKVFWDQGKQLTSIELGFGGVWALCAPHLLFIPDRDGDDAPDGEPEVLLDGWDVGPVRHNIVNGLKWGPDGWLYGRHGIQATSHVGKPGAGPAEREKVNCALWRYHPTRHTFEVVTRGTTNPWGTDWNDYGEAFFINTVIGHLWHAIPGAHYRRMYGEDFDPDLYGLIDQHADHYHWNTGEAWSDVRKGVTGTSSQAGGGHAHVGLMIYLGNNWPARYRGRALTLNMHGRRVNQDRLERHRSGYVGRHEPDEIFSDDPWFRGIELVYGPDGGVYVADWSDTGECHEQDGVHRTSGRIYKITYGTPAPLGELHLPRMTVPELVRLQLHENDWFVRQSRRMLQERGESAVAREQLLSLFGTVSSAPQRLRIMWALHAIGGADQEWLRALLDHADESVRIWAVRLLTDDRPLGGTGTPIADSLLETFQRMAREDPSAAVRLALTSTLQRLPLAQRGALAAPLLQHIEDADDHNLPLMLWYGIKGVVEQDPQLAVRWSVEGRIPLVRRFIARRLAHQFDDRQDAINDLLTAALPQKEVWPQVLSGLADGLRGRRQAPRPAIWEDVAEAVASEDALRQPVLVLSLVFGSGRALEDLQALALQTGEDLPARRAALRSLIEHRTPGLDRVSQQLLGDRDLAGLAASGLVLSDDPAIAELLVQRYKGVHRSQQPQVISALVSRASFARVLLEGVGDGRIPRSDVTAFHARQVRSFDVSELTERLGQVWGQTREMQADRRQTIARYREWLTPRRLEGADLERGRELFQQACSSCHRLHGTGGTIGPDLTGAGRDNLEYLLENIVDPSALLAEDYRMSVVTLKDGRVLTGVVARRTEQSLELQGIAERTLLAAAEIESVERSNLSLMPDGLLEAFSREQVRDLMGFLMGEGR